MCGFKCNKQSILANGEILVDHYEQKSAQTIAQCCTPLEPLCIQVMVRQKIKSMAVTSQTNCQKLPILAVHTP